jgi:leucyl-tRNA synthetase
MTRRNASRSGRRTANPSEEAWETLGHATMVCRSPWPEFTMALTIDDVVSLPVQISGKFRGTVVVPRGSDEAAARAAAMADEGIVRALEGKSVVRVVFVPDRMLNLVAKQAPRRGRYGRA